MPNWCKNSLTIRGDYGKLRNFIIKYITKDCLDFNKIIPQPKTKRECPEGYILSAEDQQRNIDQGLTGRDVWFNWYDWDCDFWGTKWGCGDCYGPADADKLAEGVTEIHFMFDTAWSPPTPVIEKLIADNPDLDIVCRYYEPGCWFAGIIDKYGEEEIGEDDIKDFVTEFFGEEFDDEDEEDTEEG